MGCFLVNPVLQLYSRSLLWYGVKIVVGGQAKNLSGGLSSATHLKENKTARVELLKKIDLTMFSRMNYN